MKISNTMNLVVLLQTIMKQNARERAQQKLCMELRQIKEAQSFLDTVRRTIK